MSENTKTAIWIWGLLIAMIASIYFFIFYGIPFLFTEGIPGIFHGIGFLMEKFDIGIGSLLLYGLGIPFGIFLVKDFIREMNTNEHNYPIWSWEKK